MSVFIIAASGPSLTKKDLDFCKGKGTVIVINNTYQLAPWADILYACDNVWWNAYPEAKEFAGRKISIQHNHPDVELWEYEQTGNGLGKSLMRTGGNSGFQALNLAYLLGAKKIILLGYDMQYTNDLAHWHGDHKRGLTQQTAFEQWINHFNIIAKDLKNEGVEVINATRETALECFKRQRLEDVEF
jgi:hypothetical protein